MATFHYEIRPGLAEDEVWRRDVRPLLGDAAASAIDIWEFCFTEILNNAVDHSGGTQITVEVGPVNGSTEMLVSDNGMGIFAKIQTTLGLTDERHAILELAKGKLTTDPANHTGQGIFFTSRLLDSFEILSGGVFFRHEVEHDEEWILQRPEYKSGTSVRMKLDNHTERTCKAIFDQYSSGDDYGFTKTVVPVKLAREGDEKLISRSQAKRILARLSLFKTVIFDFAEVASIGSSFADQIFRVFARHHPEIEVVAIHANPEVQRMIDASMRPAQNMTLQELIERFRDPNREE